VLNMPSKYAKFEIWALFLFRNKIASITHRVNQFAKKKCITTGCRMRKFKFWNSVFVVPFSVEFIVETIRDRGAM
jgi:hypothetical protein